MMQELYIWDFTLAGMSGVAKAGNKVLDFLAKLLIVCLLLYGGFSLWETYCEYTGAFLSEDLEKYKPDPDLPTDENPGLAELMKMNPDVKAWITIDDTHIDYPVLQGEDDMEYINKNVYGDFALTGSVFMSSVNKPDFTDTYNILYAHHMDNGAMFGDVLEFRKAKYFRDHKAGHLYLAEGSMDIEIFACVTCDAYDEQFYSIADKSPETMVDFLQVIQKNACQYREIDLQPTDRLIALSTCMNGSTNGRCMIIGRLVHHFLNN